MQKHPIIYERQRPHNFSTKLVVNGIVSVNSLPYHVSVCVKTQSNM